MKTFKEFIRELGHLKKNHNESTQNSGTSSRLAFWRLPNGKFKQVNQDIGLHDRYVSANPTEFGLTKRDVFLETDPSALALEKGAIRIDLRVSGKEMNIEGKGFIIQEKKGEILRFFRDYGLDSTWSIYVDFIDGASAILLMDDEGKLRKKIW